MLVSPNLLSVRLCLSERVAGDWRPFWKRANRGRLHVGGGQGSVQWTFSGLIQLSNMSNLFSAERSRTRMPCGELTQTWERLPCNLQSKTKYRLWKNTFCYIWIFLLKVLRSFRSCFGSSFVSHVFFFFFRIATGTLQRTCLKWWKAPTQRSSGACGIWVSHIC